VLPLIDNNTAPFKLEDSAREVAVAGFRSGCGKSLLSHAVALGFCEAGHSTCLVNVPSKGVRSNSFTEFMRFELGKTDSVDYAILSEEDDRSSYDRVVYDNFPQDGTQLLNCVYITPDFAEDFGLGITSEEAQRFRHEVQSKLSAQWPDIQIEFVPIWRSAMTPQSELLAKTDWMVIRELEGQLLAGSDIELLRRYIRLADLNGWELGTRI
jgi:hypothetical protein|tara:strand:- start:47 stop:679 length:633 start_codon:yes stop_codon:yes gene_type:complete